MAKRLESTIHGKGRGKAAREERERSSRLISLMAHDVRTPLGSILMMAELLAENTSGQLGERDLEYAANIQHAAVEVRDVLNGVNLLSKLISDRLEPELGRYETRAIIARLTTAMVPRAEAEGLSLDITYKKPMPRSILVDGERLIEGLGHLLEAAIEVSPQGSLSLELSSKGKKLHCLMRDQGGAIDEDRCLHLYEPFEHRARNGLRGSSKNLHMALAYAFARWMKGDLRLVDSDETGATFEMVWPLGG